MGDMRKREKAKQRWKRRPRDRRTRSQWVDGVEWYCMNCEEVIDCISKGSTMLAIHDGVTMTENPELTYQ